VSIIADRVARAPAIPAGTAARTRKPFLPTTRRGWLIVISIAVIIVLASLGWLTNGRAGLVGVTGNSMSSVIPQGSSVITLPLPPREGDYVVALAGAPDDPSGMTRGDENRSLVVKKYHDGRLVSTDDASVYSHYEYRGRVIARIPTQKILFWRDKSALKPIYRRSDVLQNEIKEQVSARTRTEQRVLEELRSKTSKRTANVDGRNYATALPPHSIVHAITVEPGLAFRVKVLLDDHSLTIVPKVMRLEAFVFYSPSGVPANRVRISRVRDAAYPYPMDPLRPLGHVSVWYTKNVR
jgi:hypothetical protein